MTLPLADARKLADDARAMALGLSPFKEQGAPGLRFCTRVKTTAVRHQW
jgi:hypothetical protein